MTPLNVLVLYTFLIGYLHMRTGLALLVSAPAMATHTAQDEMDEREFMAGKLSSESLQLRCSLGLGLQCKHS